MSHPPKQYHNQSIHVSSCILTVFNAQFTASSVQHEDVKAVVFNTVTVVYFRYTFVHPVSGLWE